MTVVTLSLTLDTTGNAAFDDAPEIEIARILTEFSAIEVARILTEFSAKILSGPGGRAGDFPLRNFKGNRIGSASLSIHKSTGGSES